MKIVDQVKASAVVGLFLGQAVFAGSTVGGGGPPAKERLEQLLSTDPVFSGLDGGLFDNGTGDIGLLTRTKLEAEILVRSSIGETEFVQRSNSQDSSALALRLSSTDFAILRDMKKPVAATGDAGQNFSFEIEAGNTIDTVILRDRRLIMRESIKSGIL